MSERLAVVIPLFNQGKWIGRAVQSVLSQNTPVDEIIVVNDGSTDDGPDIVRTFDDPRLRLLEFENAGVSAARNRGWRAAESELVCFLDADDEHLPDFTDEVRRLRERFPECGMYGMRYCREIDGQLVVFGSEESEPRLVTGFAELGRTSMVHTSAICVPKAMLSEVGGFPEDVAIGEDLECWARILLRRPCGYSELVGAVYHENPMSVMHSGPLQAGDPPFARAYAEFRASNPNFQDAEFEELIALSRLGGFLMGNWLLGRREAVRSTFRDSWKYGSCRKTWIALRLFTLMPKRVGFRIYRFAEKLKGRQVGMQLREPYRHGTR
jgi:glycosyltransferase involved in cell wall biosynthesis